MPDTNMDKAVVLIIGARGFLGQHLANALARGGAEVHAVSRSDADAADAARVERLVGEIKPAVIYQLASASQGGQETRAVLPSFENDLRTTVNTLLAAERHGCRRVVLVASLEEPVYDGRPISIPSPYAAAKAAGTFYGLMFHQLYGLPVTILRPFMAYGPGQKDHKLIPYTILSLLRGEAPRLSSGARPVDWVYVDDVIEAFVTAATAPEAVGTVIDLGSGKLVPVRHVVEQIHELIPGSPPPQFGALPDRRNETTRCADTTAAARILGWRACTPLAEGLARTVASYR